MAALGLVFACEAKGPLEDQIDNPTAVKADFLQVTKSATPTSPSEGDTVTFTVVVKNTGSQALTDVFGGDTLPTGVTYRSHTVNAGTYSSVTGLWTIGNLAQNAADTLRIKATANAGTGGQTITNRAGALTTSTAVADTLLSNNVASAPVTVQSPIPPPGGGEPTYNVAVDSLIYQDNFDAYATPNDRHARLQQLRSTQGSNHQIFLSDNRGVDNPPASFFELHQITAPGRNGSTYALRNRYLDDGNNQSSTWVTWPTGSRKYLPDTSTVVMQIYLKVNSIGWDINSPGWKFFEWWIPAGTNRTELSLSGPPGNEQFHVNPNGTGNFCFQPAVSTKWQQMNDGQWHRLTFMYRPNLVAAGNTGVVRFWVDGSKVIDCSNAGIAEGFATLSDIQKISTDPAAYLKFPDVLNTNAGRGIGSMDYDDLTWWKERGT